MTINTVLFDLDGTLIDTNELIISSFLHTLEHYYPGQYTRETVLPFMGPPLDESFGELNSEKVDEMIAHYREYNLEHHDELVKEFVGVKETVVALHSQGYKMAIVSTKLHDSVVKGLKLTGLDQYFDVIIGYDDVTKAKPDPEPVFKALQALGSEPIESIMIGDNHHDIEAGQNAGTKTAAVAWSTKGREHLMQFHPDYMLEEMKDLLRILEVR
ncbi:pyrophosphatase [Bacillus coahuilensis m2-6]|uniref:Pyrophosphatase PpaX n=1 Tax=Bacillus coahuilensis p1.1.43 TaxID=1150625 RepID=A0A147K5Z7_9BACI|nr:pyrophosphatase PpaX [Bacillus coahuilensis]KUP05211.1 pyrophosphatase [Bacillus coahuilensis p1.1.43]KUP05662.1 pyrophosphatase [Bacillus coahuilensis m2-6]